MQTAKIAHSHVLRMLRCSSSSRQAAANNTSTSVAYIKTQLDLDTRSGSDVLTFKKVQSTAPFGGLTPYWLYFTSPFISISACHSTQWTLSSCTRQLSTPYGVPKVLRQSMQWTLCGCYWQLFTPCGVIVNGSSNAQYAVLTVQLPRALSFRKSH